MWACGGGVRLREVIDATSLDLFVAHAPAAFGPAGSASVDARGRTRSGLFEEARASDERDRTAVAQTAMTATNAESNARSFRSSIRERSLQPLYA
jgi:hypothetical protein